MTIAQRNPPSIIILAAGEGTRMRSELPKPLHRIGCAPLLQHVLTTAAALRPEHLVVVVGHGGETVAATARKLAPQVQIVEQSVRRGTGDATRLALAAIALAPGDLLVLYGDTPLLRTATLQAMLDRRADGAAVVALGFETAEPGAYGRLILGDDGGLERIVEARDATPAEAAVRLCNSGVMAFDAEGATRWIAGLRSRTAAGELYLTDVVEAARSEGRRCAVERCDRDECLGVNDRIELAAAEAVFQSRARTMAMAGGATMLAPDTVHLAFDTRLGRDVVIEPHVVFGPGVTVEDGAEIGAFSRLEGCVLRPGARVGPHARVRSPAISTASPSTAP